MSDSVPYFPCMCLILQKNVADWKLWLIDSRMRGGCTGRNTVVSELFYQRGLFSSFLSSNNRQVHSSITNHRRVDCKLLGDLIPGLQSLDGLKLGSVFSSSPFHGSLIQQVEKLLACKIKGQSEILGPPLSGCELIH